MGIFRNTELIQSFIRLTIGLLTYLYISSGIDSNYFDTSHQVLNYFTASFFTFSFILILSIIWLPVSKPRRYLALAFDVASTTFSSYLTGGINSVYVLVYLWIYIGYGTRYGLRFLSTAVAFTLVGYNVLLLTEDAWHLLTLEAIAFLLLIIALPVYLYSLQKKLMLTAEKAQAESRAKTEFLSNMTHQIRTPIGGIVGMIDLLNKTDLDVQQKQYLQSLSQSSHSLQEIIEDIVDFSRIENGNILLSHNRTNSRSLIDSLVHSLAPIGYDRDLELICYIDESFPDEVSIDAQRFRQLLSNLIRYAIEHSTSQGIYIHAYASGLSSSRQQNVCIEIQFRQDLDAHHLTSNQIPDTNEALPLRIGYQLTRLMNGLFEIQYQDNNEITFSLHFNWQPVQHPREQQQKPTAGKRVLIYDTNKLSRFVLVKYCELLGLEVYATSGADNLIAHIIWSKDKKQPFDIILLSEDRKNRNCKELAMRIRNEARCQTPILYATYMHNFDDFGAENLKDVQTTTIKPISLDMLRNTLNKTLGSESVQGATREQEPPAQASLSILLAEDNEINASVIYSHLTELGHNVDIATDGNTALYAMNQHHYDLVLMDLNMPNMDGIEATRQWRRLEKVPSHLPIIAITAKATSEDREHCLRAGMDDFLPKPANMENLREVINRHLPSNTVQY